MRGLVHGLRDIAKHPVTSLVEIDRLKAVVAAQLPSLRAGAACEARRGLGPGRYMCHRDSEAGFVVMMLAWAPGDATPIHDHGCWGVEAVLAGALSVTNFDEDEVDPRPLGTMIMSPGAVMHNLPPARDIHRVANCGSGLALSLHIYGREMTGNRFFVPGEGYKTGGLRQMEPAFLDFVEPCEGTKQAWGRLWSESSNL